MVVAIAGEEVRDPRDVVGANEAEKVLEERDQLVAFGGDDRHVAEAQRRCAGLLEAGSGGCDRVVELDDHAARRLDFDQFGDAGLTVGLDCRGEAKLARVASEVADRDVGLQVKAHMEQRLLFGRAQRPRLDSNARLIALGEAGVTFKWKDYRIKGRDRLRTMTFDAAEFIRRFLLHVLPGGFHRIRPL